MTRNLFAFLAAPFFAAALFIGTALPVSAQTTPQANAALRAISQMRSQCDNAAWTLWYSNDYKKWRAKQSSMLSMNYSYSVPKEAPQAPAEMPEELRTRFNTIVKAAIDTVNEAAPLFRDLATYINAKDFEDDKFKKGDTLNVQLLSLGEKCHTLTKELDVLHADYADTLIGAYAGDPAKSARVEQLRDDLKAVQVLGAEMVKSDKADRAVIETAVADISKRVEDRKASLPTGSAQADASMKSFYLSNMEDDVAVEMRKLLRESKKNPKAWKEIVGDRPRSPMMRVRNAAFIQMPDAALSALQ